MKLSIFLLVVGVATLAIATTSPAPESIHKKELTHWNEQVQNGWHPYQDPQDIPVKPLGHQPRFMTHEVHGYHPYWAQDAYTQYDWSLITTIAFFGLELSAQGVITNNHGWPWTGLVSMAHDHGTRVIITITNFHSPDIETLLNTSSFRMTAINNIVAAVQLGAADGVNIDFEYITSAARESFVTFIADLNTALHEILEEPYLSIATPAVDWNGSYNYAALAEHCDHLMIMAYNYHYSASATTGPVAPLSGWGTFNIPWTINDYLYWGVVPSSILLGVPYFGYNWPSTGPDPAAATTSSASAITFAAACPESETHSIIWDDESQTPWYRYETDQWHQVWFDNQNSLSSKYEYTKNQSLAGIGIWALSYDGSRPELWSALRGAFQENTAAPGFSHHDTSRLRAPTPTPNPMGGETLIRFQLAQSSPLAIRVYDLRGHQVADLLSGWQPEGHGSLTWNPQGLASGIYLIRYTTTQTDLFRRVVWVQ